ncbi:hypothetical protein BpHYR1_009048 [Brachionus plicatilis]|uniref:Uncharacterized protein n=1 Tax=Brachionus plicatilis TaxID=10195 RepID=A0A3M7SVI3_BRAPC|nr:hypothetical protein BpHYR1_009048 [Brachionus plicatilis]
MSQNKEIQFKKNNTDQNGYIVNWILQTSAEGETTVVSLCFIYRTKLFKSHKSQVFKFSFKSQSPGFKILNTEEEILNYKM